MRWLQSPTSRAGAHRAPGGREGSHPARAQHEAVADTLDLLEAEQAHRLDAESWGPVRGALRGFRRVSWADLVSERLGHRLTVPLTPARGSGAPASPTSAARDFREEGSGIYDKVYSADRPELFFKSTASALRGTRAADLDAGAIRASPPPSPSSRIVIGPRRGDLSVSRSRTTCPPGTSSARNPLYLPQSKVYTAASRSARDRDPGRDPRSLRSRAHLPGGPQRAGGLQRLRPARASSSASFPRSSTGSAARTPVPTGTVPRPEPVSSSRWTSVSRGRLVVSPSPAREIGELRNRVALV